MYGAILGDIIGNTYKEKEISNQEKLFTKTAGMTELSKGTADLCVALFDSGKEISTDKIAKVIEKRFHQEVKEKLDSMTLAIMLTSAGWIFQTISEVKTGAREVAGILCPDFESIQLAQGVSGAVFYARKGKSKDEILHFLSSESGYELQLEDAENFTLAKTEESEYILNAAFRAFYQEDDFEAVVREALATAKHRHKVCVLASALAEAYYGMPDELRKQVRKHAGANPDVSNVLARFDSFFGRVIRDEEKDLSSGAGDRTVKINGTAEEMAQTGDIREESEALSGIQILERAIELFHQKQDKQSFIILLETLRHQMNQETEVMVPVEFTKEFLEELEKQNVKTGEIEQLEDEIRFRIRTISDPEGKEWCPAFTSDEELNKGSATSVIEYDLESILEAVADSPKVEGIVFNPFGVSFTLKKEGIKVVLGVSQE